MIGADFWKELGIFSGAVLTAGGLVGAVMKGFFVTKKACDDSQTRCGGRVCRELKEIKDRTEQNKVEAITKREAFETRVLGAIADNKDVVNTHYAEAKRYMGYIDGKLEKVINGR